MLNEKEQWLSTLCYALRPYNTQFFSSLQLCLDDLIYCQALENTVVSLILQANLETVGKIPSAQLIDSIPAFY